MRIETAQRGVVRIAIRTAGPDHGGAEAVPVAVRQFPPPRWPVLGRLVSRRRDLRRRHRGR